MIGQAILHYKILEKLGEGGMGVVYKAEDTKLERIVAIKFLPHPIVANADERERFKIEAKAAAALNHPNIATIHATEEVDGEMFIVMEFIDGKELRKIVTSDQLQLPVNSVIEIVAQIAEGLKAAHAKGITHRDIKSSNVMVTESGQVKIMDFGLAKIGSGTHLTKTGMTVGTIAYMSPEQTRGEEVDHRTDIWSFGVVLYEMLTGQLPFQAEYEAALLYSIVYENPESVSEIRPETPVKLAKIVNKALEKNPEKRYESMQHIIVDLKGVLDADSGSVDTSGASAISLHESPAMGQKDRISQQGERRQVTIVVSTLAGYDGLVERLEPEAVRDVTEEISRKVAEIASKYNGLVNQFNEDEIVLLFGIPVTREDDLSRAVKATFELHGAVRKLSDELSERHDEEIHIHSGIDTGIVVAQSHDGGNRKFKLTGETVQMASRLAEEARQDEILINSECRRLIKPFFDTEARETFKIRGKVQPVRPFAIQGGSGFHSRLEAIDSVKLTPFIGRDRELHALKNSLEKVINGDGQFITVIGEAGLGKSRLLYEFRNQIDPDIDIKQGRCQSYGSNIPYLPFIELLKELLHIASNDYDGNHVENVASQIRDLDPGLENYIPLFLHLLAIQSTKYPLPDFMQGDHIQDAIVEGLAAIITVAANKKPMVVLLEDWHWVDDASQKIVKQLAEMVSNFPLCLIVTYRPEAVFEWGNPTNHTRIQLAPLDTSFSLEIIKSVLGAKNLSEKLAALIHERTGGNPFFVEEMSQSLQEEGSIRIEKQKILLTESASKIHLPQTIQAVIRSRLDRLDPDALEVLRAAAVIGREFTQNILEDVTVGRIQLGESLRALRNSGLIQQIRVLPEATFRFKHILTQEVAYDSLLQYQRKALHSLVGEVFEKVYHGRLEEQATILMEHFSRAENWQKAVYYGCKVADDPMKHSSYVLDILDKVGDWILKLPENQERREILIDVLLRKERTCETLGYLERQKQIIDRLLTLVESDDINRAEVYIRLGDLFILSNRLEEAENALKEAYRLSKELGHGDTEQRVLRSMGYLKVHSGRDDEAVSIIRKVIEMSIQKGIADVLVQDLNSLFTILIRLGDYDGAKKCVDDALDLYDQVPLRHRTYINFMAGNYYRHMGEYDKAISYLTAMVQLLEGYGYGGKPTTAFLPLAHIYLIRGNVEEALRCYEKAVDMSRTRKIASELAIALNAMGTALLSLGRNTESLLHLEEAALVFRQLQDSKNETQVLCTLANVLEKDGKHHDALSTWENIRKMGEQAGDLRIKLNAVKGMASATRRLADDSSHALKYYQEALQLAQGLEDLDEQGEILNTMGIMAWQSGHYEQALRHYEKALEIFLEKDDKKHAGFILNSMASTLIKLNRHEQALARLDEAMQFHKQADQLLLEGHALAMRGDLYFELQELHRAQQNYESSLELRQKLGDRQGEGWMWLQLAKVFAAQGLAAKSRAYAERALTIAKECDDSNFLDEVQAYLQRFSFE